MSVDFTRARAALAGRYRLRRELGSGGMATVFLAEDPRHRRDVAIKVLHPEIASSIGPERFLREIEIAAGLMHPNILSLLDSGEADGLLYYVMPLVEGHSLRDRLRREGELPVGEAIEILRDLLEALSYAHGRGIVHRDVKPENVLLTGSRAQLADFGIAKALHDAAGGAPLTRTGIAVGTPAYMAPEQAAGDPHTDHRADLYALGVMAYEILAGHPPFQGSNPQQLIAAHMSRAAEPLGAIRATVPAPVAAAVMRCLEKRPADRCQTAEEMLRRLAAEEPGAAGTAATPRPPASGSLRITEELCGKLDRASFDPRMIGDQLHYLDNGASSDVLMLLLDRWGLDAGASARLLDLTRYRTVIPTLFGFDLGRKVRFGLGIRDHALLLEALLRQLTDRLEPRIVIVVGFSAAGDLVLRLAATADPATRIDGCLSLGCNLGIETCFVSRVLAGVESSAPEEVLPALNAALAGATTVNDWLAVSSYLTQILANFQSDWTPVRRFAQGIVEPWETEGLEAFIGWYRAATALGRRVRCVFEDNDSYRSQVREIQLRNLDRKILGEGYRTGSIVVEPVASHFDLMEPERLVRHIDALVAELRAK